MEFEIAAIAPAGKGGQLNVTCYGVGDKETSEKDECPFFHTPRNSVVMLNLKREAVKALGWKVGTRLILAKDPRDNA